MADCRREGIRYKRHQMVNGTCSKCGAIKVTSEQAEAIIQAAISKATETVAR